MKLKWMDEDPPWRSVARCGGYTIKAFHDGDLGCAREVLAGPFASLNEAIGAATMINRCGDRILPIVQPARGGEHA